MRKVGSKWLALTCCLVQSLTGCADVDGEQTDEPAVKSADALLERDVVPFTPRPPALDGSDDGAWGNRAPTQGCAHVLFGTPSNDNDFGCRWVVIWDDTALYLYIDTADDVLRAGVSPIPWQNDSVELYIDADGSGGHHYDRVNDFQYILASDVPRVAFGINSVRRATGVRYTLQLYPGAAGVTMRIAVPWSTLRVKPEPGLHVGLEMQFNDNDKGLLLDAKVSTFATRDNAWRDPSAFGYFTLGERTTD